MEFRDDPNYLLICTCGSLLSESNSNRFGAGIVCYQQQDEVFEHTIGLGPENEVYDAELAGLTGAAELIHALRIENPANFPQNIHFFCDNAAAVGFIFTGKAQSGQQRSIRFREIILQYLDACPDNKVMICWTPGHQDVQGNERADKLAKAATSRPSTEPPSITHLRRKAKQQPVDQWVQEWKSDPPNGRFAIADRRAPSPIQTTHFILINRKTFAKTIQCRTGHAFIGNYYKYFVPTEPTQCHCGARLQTRAHILKDCPKYDLFRDSLSNVSEELDLAIILGTKPGIAALSEFIETSGAFRKTNH